MMNLNLKQLAFLACALTAHTCHSQETPNHEFCWIYNAAGGRIQRWESGLSGHCFKTPSDLFEYYINYANKQDNPHEYWGQGAWTYYSYQKYPNDPNGHTCENPKKSKLFDLAYCSYSLTSCGYNTWIPLPTHCNTTSGAGQWIAAMATCAPDRKYNYDLDACLPIIDTYINPPSCPTENPFLTLTGTKIERLDLGIYFSNLSAQLNYDSSNLHTDSTQIWKPIPGSSINTYTTGPNWRSNLFSQLIKNSSGTAIQALRDRNIPISFVKDGGSWKSQDHIFDTLTSDSNGFLYYDTKNEYVEKYSSDGLQLLRQHRTGGKILNSYSDDATPKDTAPRAGLLIELQEHTGKTIQFTYSNDTQTPQIASIASGNHKIELSYGGNKNISKVNWTDDTAQEYRYTDTRHPYALTEIIDSADKIFASFTYSASGVATATKHAGNTNAFIFNYTQEPTTRVREYFDGAAYFYRRIHEFVPPTSISATLPNNSTSTEEFQVIAGLARPIKRTKPAGSGCNASAMSNQYDANGHVSSTVDFNGNRVCFKKDALRGLEVSRIEGLSASDTCPTGTTLKVNSRQTSSQWHPDWRIHTKIAAPSTLSTWVYNGQPDPFAGGATASCAPSNALLPDGKPIVVLCKRVEQATTDVDGSKGFAASLQAGVPARVWTYTYNEFGQVLTEKDPLNNLTTRAYYSDTTASYTKGDLQSITNALGQITRFTEYNPMGQVLKMVDANEVITEYRYDLRQRLTDVIVNGLSINRYEYWPTGLLKRAVQADDSFVAYEYDDAHRLTAAADAKGNRIEYTLDNAGQRTAEKVKDPGGSLARQLTRVHDALGRLQQLTGRN